MEFFTPLRPESSSSLGLALVMASSTYQIERGALPLTGAGISFNSVQLSGKTLLDMEADDYSDPTTLQQSKMLMRTLINHYLGQTPIHTRQLLRDLHQL